jgi:hypothetical protein
MDFYFRVPEEKGIDLPHPILLKIFGYLDIHDAAHLSQACSYLFLFWLIYRGHIIKCILLRDLDISTGKCPPGHPIYYVIRHVWNVLRQHLNWQVLLPYAQTEPPRKR